MCEYLAAAILLCLCICFGIYIVFKNTESFICNLCLLFENVHVKTSFTTQTHFASALSVVLL